MAGADSCDFVLQFLQSASEHLLNDLRVQRSQCARHSLCYLPIKERAHKVQRKRAAQHAGDIWTKENVFNVGNPRV
jgi:hypothetical protein